MNDRFSGEIVYHTIAPLPCAPVPILRTPLVRLDRLRRSARMAAFALVVFVLRIGMVAACAPSDYAELSNHDDATASVVVSAEVPADDDTQHSAGHCLHCSCHHAVALPGALVAPPPKSAYFVGVSPLIRQITAPPDLSLRPPIR